MEKFKKAKKLKKAGNGIRAVHRMNYKKVQEKRKQDYNKLYNGTYKIWERRIRGKKKAAAQNYHVQRYEAWLEYIDANWPESITWHQDRQKHKITSKNVWLPSNQWKKITIINKDTTGNFYPYVVFDASFGSVAETSDFDVVVKCTEVAPLEKWITFLKTWHVAHPGYIFTNYFDSNFYFEPSYMTSNNTLISFMNKRMISREMEEPVHNNEIKFLDAIKKYKDGYRTSTVVKHKYQFTTNDQHFYPNPLGFENNVQREIKQYTLMKDVNSQIMVKNSKFIKARGLKGKLEYTADDIIDSAFTKTEGLIAPGSLAICQVFGKKTFTKYVIKHTPGAVSSWRLISAYEMLCNMQMHEHNNLIKTKYIGRFINSMPNYSGNCAVIARAIENTLKVKEIVSFSDTEHAKKEKWSTISLLISALIDLIYKHETRPESARVCDLNNDSKSRARTLDDDLEIMYNMVIRKFSKDPEKANEAIKKIINSNSNPVKTFQACVRTNGKVKCETFSKTGKNETYHRGIGKVRKISASKRKGKNRANFTDKANKEAQRKRDEYMKELNEKINEYMKPKKGKKGKKTRTRKEARKLALADLAKKAIHLAKKKAIPEFHQFVLEF